MKKLLWLFIVGVAFFSLVLASCSSPAPASTANMKITVATDATWAPFEYVDEQTKQIVGFDIDVFDAIAKNQNLGITYKNVAFDPLLAGMAQGMYDAAISSITIKEDRKKNMLFSDPYFVAGQMVVVKIDNTKITEMSKIEGPAGAQTGTTGADEIQKIKAATLKPYDDIGLAFQDLMNGQINAVVCDNPVALQYVAKNSTKIKSVGGLYTTEDYGIAVAKGKTDLLNRINAGLKAVKSQGLIDQLSKKWLEK
jgi:polar amino acid transport system substrate-binding protein